MIFYSIRTKILFLGLVFVALIGIAFFIYSMNTTVNYEILRLEAINKTVSYETAKVNKLIADIEHSAIFFALSGLLCFRAQSETLGEDMVIQYINNFPVLLGGGFWFEPYAFNSGRIRSGFCAFRDKETGNVLIDEKVFLDEYDYHNKSWYREIFDNITEPYQVVWTRPYLDDSGAFSLMTTAGAGIFDENGKLIAITTADWEIEEVIRELNAIKPTPNSFILLCVPEKDYVISSTRTNAVTGVPLSSIPWDITADAFHFNGIDYIRFERFMDNGWLLSVQIPVNEIVADIQTQNEKFSLLIALVSVAMLFVAWYLISRLVNNPLKQFTQDVSQIAIGNLNTQIKVSTKDELGMLAKVINKMTFDLKKSIEERETEHAEKEKIKAELNVAADIQASMLPCVFPPFPGRKEFELFAAMIPAKEVCGDFYDFFFIDKDNLAVVIADVSGKGVPAALFMVIAKTLIKNCSSCRNPMSVFNSVNKKLCEGNETQMFVTAFIGFLNIPSGKLTFVNAGHNPPIIRKKDNNQTASFAYLKSKPNTVLGFMENIKYQEDEIFLEEGDILFLYTDGITEAMNINKVLYGETRLLESANKNRDLPPQELLNAVKQDVDVFINGAEQADDITMLVLQITENGEQITGRVEQPAEKSEEVKCKSELKIAASVNNLTGVIRFIERELDNYDCSSIVKNEICIAVEEIFMNIVNYAYNQSGGDVSIEMTTDQSFPVKTIIKFEDSGRLYNPLEQPAPDFGLSIEDRQIGGLGVFLFKQLMDSVDYTRVNGKNVLVIGKNHQKTV